MSKEGEKNEGSVLLFRAAEEKNVGLQHVGLLKRTVGKKGFILGYIHSIYVKTCEEKV